MLLKSMIGDIKTEKRVKAAANKHFGHCKAHPVFEHGHWWVKYYDETEDTNRVFDVVDAEGPGSIDGFGFEEV